MIRDRMTWINVWFWNWRMNASHSSYASSKSKFLRTQHDDDQTDRESDFIDKKGENPVKLRRIAGCDTQVARNVSPAVGSLRDRNIAGPSSASPVMMTGELHGTTRSTQEWMKTLGVSLLYLPAWSSCVDIDVFTSSGRASTILSVSHCGVLYYDHDESSNSTHSKHTSTDTYGASQSKHSQREGQREKQSCKMEALCGEGRGDTDHVTLQHHDSTKHCDSLSIISNMLWHNLRGPHVVDIWAELTSLSMRSDSSAIFSLSVNFVSFDTSFTRVHMSKRRSTTAGSSATTWTKSFHLLCSDDPVIKELSYADQHWTVHIQISTALTALSVTLRCLASSFPQVTHPTSSNCKQTHRSCRKEEKQKETNVELRPRSNRKLLTLKLKDTRTESRSGPESLSEQGKSASDPARREQTTSSILQRVNEHWH